MGQHVKKVLYDWIGGNEYLFKEINSLGGDEWYDNAMITVSNVFETHNFPYFLGFFLLSALVGHTIYKLQRLGGTRRLSLWLAALTVMTLAFVANIIVVGTLKEHFEYPRPYAVLAPEDVHQLEFRPVQDDFRSFPSGHAAFVALLVASLWPVSTLGLRIAGALLILLVSWSRIAVGMHFPADTLAGIGIGIAVVIVVRMVCYSILRRVFGLNC